MNNDTMKNESGVEENGGRGRRLGRRLKGVRKRKRVRRFECETVTLKMRLLKGEEDSNH